MTLSEKITYCRRKSGLSQEGLAEKLGVSRQAVSKWETGEAQPELSKLKQLSDLFGVSADWLLNEDEPFEPQPQREAQTQTEPQTPSFLDRLPGFVRKLFRRFGWLAGVYTMIIGALMALLGGTAILISDRMLDAVHQNASQMFDPVGYGAGAMTMPTVVNPVSILGKVIVGVGALIFVIGVVLTVVLLRARKQEQGER